MIISVFDKVFVAHDANSTNIKKSSLTCPVRSSLGRAHTAWLVEIITTFIYCKRYTDSDSNQTRAIVVEHVPNFSLEKHFNRD